MIFAVFAKVHNRPVHYRMDTSIDRELRTKISSASSDEDENRSPFFSTLTSSFMLTKMQTKLEIRFGTN